MSVYGVGAFWLAVWIVYLLWRVHILKTAIRMNHDVHARLLLALTQKFPAVKRLEKEDDVLESEVIE